MKRTYLALIALLSEGRSALLPGLGLLASTAALAALRGRLAPGVDIASFADTVVATQGWVMAILLAIALPPFLTHGMARGGTPHRGLLAMLHTSPPAVIAATSILGLLTLGSALPALTFSSFLGAGYSDILVQGLAPGAICLTIVSIVATVAHRLAPALHLSVQYTILASLLFATSLVVTT